MCMEVPWQYASAYRCPHSFPLVVKNLLTLARKREVTRVLVFDFRNGRVFTVYDKITETQGYTEMDEVS